MSYDGPLETLLGFLGPHEGVFGALDPPGCVTAQGITMPATQAAITGGANSHPTGAPNNSQLPNKTMAEAIRPAPALIPDEPAPRCTIPSMVAAMGTPASVPRTRPKRLPRGAALGSTTSPNRPPEMVPHTAPARTDLLKTSRRGRGTRDMLHLVIAHRNSRSPSCWNAPRLPQFYRERYRTTRLT